MTDTQRPCPLCGADVSQETGFAAIPGRGDYRYASCTECSYQADWSDHVALRSPEPAQAEPVAWMYEKQGGQRFVEFQRRDEDVCKTYYANWTETALYACPPAQADQQPDYDDEITQAQLVAIREITDPDVAKATIRQPLYDQQPPEDAVDKGLRVALASALAFAASRSAITSDEEKALLAAFDNTHITAREEQARQEGRQQAFEEAASIGYIACAETRHVSMGDKVEAAIRAKAGDSEASA